MRVVIVSVFMGVVKVALTYPWLSVAHSMVSEKKIVFSYSESDHGIQAVPMRR
jgi:hypothetical protein